MSRAIVVASICGAFLLWSETIASPGPTAIAANMPIPVPRDRAYAGEINLAIDATDTARRIVHVRETLSGVGPDTILLYPKWLPGTHAPEGPIDRLAGLKITANGAPVSWTRDPVDVYAFRLHPGAAVRSIAIEFDYLSPTSEKVGVMEISRDLLMLEWNAMVLYPAGYFTRQIPVQASVTLPAGWKSGSALETASTDGAQIIFKRTDLETLIDSPLYSGRYVARFDLDPGGAVPIYLNLFADRPELLTTTPEQLAGASRAGAAGLQAVRLASFRALRLPVLAERSRGTERTRASSVERRRHRSGTSFIDWDQTAWRAAICCRTNSSTPGTASSAVRPICGPPTTTCRCRAACCGSTKARRNTGARYWPRAPACARSSRRSISWPMTAAYYAHADRAGSWRALQDTTDDEIINPRRPQCRGATGSASRTTTTRAS